MRILLWVLQVVLAVAFGASGFMKMTQPYEQIVAAMAWAGAVSPLLLQLIGAVEVLGAIGLILPPLLRIRPGLTPLAAAGLATVMVLAAVFHLLRGEVALVVPNLVLLALAAFVAYGRTVLAPFRPRGEAAAERAAPAGRG
jgi:uncharacterized membrane protein YphA (DoxX/SURF4 family)